MHIKKLTILNLQQFEQYDFFFTIIETFFLQEPISFDTYRDFFWTEILKLFASFFSSIRVKRTSNILQLSKIYHFRRNEDLRKTTSLLHIRLAVVKRLAYQPKAIGYFLL